mgnify:CR=1 FL=1
MRIEAYNQIAQIYGSNKTKSVAKTEGKTAKDEFTISKAGRDFQIAKQAVSGASDVREDKVAEVKSRIDSGTYEVSNDDFAAKLMEKFSGLS